MPRSLKLKQSCFSAKFSTLPKCNPFLLMSFLCFFVVVGRFLGALIVCSVRNLEVAGVSRAMNDLLGLEGVGNFVKMTCILFQDAPGSFVGNIVEIAASTIHQDFNFNLGKSRDPTQFPVLADLICISDLNVFCSHVSGENSDAGQLWNIDPHFGQLRYYWHRLVLFGHALWRVVDVKTPRAAV